MAENKMAEVAKSLGVELEEEFRIEGFYNKYKFTNYGLMNWSTNSQQWFRSSNLNALIRGELTIIKLPKPILDEKEKEYLSNVIKPFRDSVVAIVKRGDYGCDNYSCIRIIVEQNGNLEWISLPIFKTETMYNGMEIDRDYILEELGL